MRALPYVRRPQRRRQRGSTAVEFALVFPLFFALVAGAIEGGRFVVTRMMLSYAVSVGARAATLRNASTGTVATAVQNAAPMLHLTATQVEVSTLSGGTLVALTLPAAVGTPVTVSVGVTNSGHKYQFTSLLPSKLSPFTTRSWSAQATMTAR